MFENLNHIPEIPEDGTNVTDLEETIEDAATVDFEDVDLENSNMSDMGEDFSYDSTEASDDETDFIMIDSEETDLTPEEDALLNDETTFSEDDETAFSEDDETAFPEDDETDFSEDDEEVFSEEGQEETSSALTIPRGNYMSQLSFDEKVLEKIVSVAIHEMDGVLLAGSGGGFFSIKNNRGIRIQVNDNDDVSLELDVMLEYGKSAPEIFEQLNKLLSQRISTMTGLNLKNVNVHVTNVLTSQEFNEKN